MSEPKIIFGEGVDKNKIRQMMTLIAAQVLAAGHDIRLPAIKHRDSGPFNKTQEQARRCRQLQRAREGRDVGMSELRLRSELVEIIARRGFGSGRIFCNRVVDDDGPSCRAPFPHPYLADGSANPVYVKTVDFREFDADRWEWHFRSPRSVREELGLLPYIDPLCEIPAMRSRADPMVVYLEYQRLLFSDESP